MHLPCPIGTCGIVRESTSVARKAHCEQYHGYPECTTCHQVIRNINMFEHHLQQPHASETCQLCGEDVVKGTEKMHAERSHGFPTCFICHKTAFTQWPSFVMHMKSHKTVACCLPPCEATFLEGGREEQAHYRDYHGYPVCGVCGRDGFHRLNNFLSHQKTHMQTKCLFPECGSTFLEGGREEQAHYRECHGYPVCGVCGRDGFESFNNFFMHMKSHKTVACCLPPCEATFLEGGCGEEAHYRDYHGYPVCGICDREGFDSLNNFLIHYKTHMQTKCLFPECDAMVYPGAEQDAHYRGAHHFPSCRACKRVCDNYANFVFHVQQCTCLPCLYPDCRGIWSPKHLYDEHDANTCVLCDKTKSSIDKLAKHVKRCAANATVFFECDMCAAKCGTPELLRAHVCLPPIPAQLRVDEYFALTERHCTQLEVVNQRDKAAPRYHVTARIRKSTLGMTARDYRELSKRQLKTLKLDQDPTGVEVMEPGLMPMPVFFMPAHFHFEQRMRMVHELEEHQPAWAFWLVLVYRVMNFCTDPYGRDVLWYQKFLEDVKLPPGVPDDCSQLLVVRARVKHMWDRARRHRHIKVLMNTVGGKKELLGAQLRKVDDAYRASKRFKGLSEDNSVDGSSDDVEHEEVRALTLQGDTSEWKDDVGGRQGQKPANACLLRSSEVPLAVGERASVPLRRRVASDREVEWQEMLHHFFHHVLKPVIRSRRLTQLQSWFDVQWTFLDHALIQPDEGPMCRLPDNMHWFLSKVVKLDRENMTSVSLQPNVLVPNGWDSDQE